MKIYQDIFSNDEFVSDIFEMKLDFNDTIYKVKSAYKNKDAIGQIDTGCGNAFGGGDEEEQGGDDAQPAEKVLDVAYNAGLVETQYSKADFMTYIKAYLKKIAAHLKENGNEAAVPDFQKAAQDFVKKIVGDFDNWTFYTGSSENSEGGLAFSFWEDEGAAGPMFYFFKHGMKEVKC